jgi:cystathionine gamma-synthase
VYVEERYGRNLPLQLASNAKKMLRRRIAGVLVHDGPAPVVSADATDVQLGLSSRGVAGVTEDDVYLYPTGMAAIWSAHQLLLAVRPLAQSVCFGCVSFSFCLFLMGGLIKLVGV